MNKKKMLHRDKLFFYALLVSLFMLVITAKNTLPNILYGQSNIQAENLTGVYDTTDTQGVFYSNSLVSSYTDGVILAKNILGNTTEEKRIEIDLTNQRLYAFEGNKKVYDFLISSGKWGGTPLCNVEENCRIWIKLRYAKMSGGNKNLGTYYYIPNVPFVMYFSGKNIPAHKGFGIHGAYWHNNFGHPMSHGCINMKVEDAEKIFYWVQPIIENKPSVRATQENPGTQIIIYGKAPRGFLY